MASPTTGGSSALKSPRSKTEKDQPKEKRPQGFQKGDPRINRKGRPKKGETFSDIIRELAELKDIRTPAGERIQRKRAVIEKIYSKAIQEGDLPSAKFLVERVDPPAGSEPPEGEENVLAPQVWQAIIAMVRRATEDHPEARKKIVKALNAAQFTD